MKPEDRIQTISISHFGDSGGQEDQYAITACKKRKGEIMELIRNGFTGERRIICEIPGDTAPDLVRVLNRDGFKVVVDF